MKTRPRNHGKQIGGIKTQMRYMRERLAAAELKADAVTLFIIVFSLMLIGGYFLR